MLLLRGLPLKGLNASLNPFSRRSDFRQWSTKNSQSAKRHHNFTFHISNFTFHIPNRFVPGSGPLRR